MAYIQDGASVAGNLAIETASKAARNILYNAAGAPVTRKHNSARDEANDEAFIIGGYNDGNYRHIRTDRTGGQAVALNTMLLTESFENASLPASRWSAINTTMAASISPAAGILFNSTSITTVSTGYLLKSLRSFLKQQRAPLHFKARARLAHVVNSVMEIGFGDAATFNGANTNGAYWQVTSGGALQPVLTYNGVDITGAAVTGLSPAISTHSTFCSTMTKPCSWCRTQAAARSLPSAQSKFRSRRPSSLPSRICLRWPGSTPPRPHRRARRKWCWPVSMCSCSTA